MRRWHKRRPTSASVRQQGDMIELKLYSTYGGNMVYFKGRAPLNNHKALKALFDAAQSKGLDLSDIYEPWW